MTLVRAEPDLGRRAVRRWWWGVAWWRWCLRVCVFMCERERPSAEVGRSLTLACVPCGGGGGALHGGGGVYARVCSCARERPSTQVGPSLAFLLVAALG